MSSSVSNHQLAFETALKAGVALTIAAAVSFYFHYSLFWWAIFICFLGVMPDVGSSIMGLSMRFIGTVLGAISAIIISLTVQFPWAYYPLTIVFIGVCIYFIVKPIPSLAAALCMFTGAVCLLVGPEYPQGVIYYAAERFMQIVFAMAIVVSTLIILRSQYAHVSLRTRLVDLVKDYKELWLQMGKDIFEGATTGSSQKRVREIATEIVALRMMLVMARYEIGKRNFNTEQCLRLLRLLKRILGLMMAMNETARYVKASDFPQDAQEVMSKLNQTMTAAFDNLVQILQTTAFSYDVAINQVEQEFSELMDRRLEEFSKVIQDNPLLGLHRVAWFSYVKRIFRAMDFSRKVAVLMNVDKKNKCLAKDLDEEMIWLKGLGEKKLKINPIRLRLGVHGAITAGIMIWLQQYFLWSPLVGLIGVLAILFASMSLVMPISGHLGLGVLGAVSGLIYVFLAAKVLNYYPQATIALGFLFVAAVIASYLNIYSRLTLGKFFMFSVLFALVVVYTLVSQPADRGNFDIPLTICIAFLMGVLVYGFVSRFIFPLNYKKILQQRLSESLVEEARLLRGVCRSCYGREGFVMMQDKIYQQSERIDFARLAVGYCINRQYYDEKAIAKIYEVTYSCELMLLSNLTLLQPYFTMPGGSIIEEFYQHIHTELFRVNRNLIRYAANIRNNNWDKQVCDDIAALKQACDQRAIEFLPRVLSADCKLSELRTFAMIYGGLCRLLDVQQRLLTLKGFVF